MMKTFSTPEIWRIIAFNTLWRVRLTDDLDGVRAIV